MRDERMPDPLPEGWLPEPAAEAGGEDLWEERVRRVVAAAEPRLRELERAGRAPAPTAVERPAGWREVGRWWRPAAALATAAVLALFLASPTPPEAPVSRGSPALAAVASDGEPASLWGAAGSEAHPVLALIALEGETPGLEEETR